MINLTADQMDNLHYALWACMRERRRHDRGRIPSIRMDSIQLAREGFLRSKFAADSSFSTNYRSCLLSLSLSDFHHLLYYANQLVNFPLPSPPTHSTVQMYSYLPAFIKKNNFIHCTQQKNTGVVAAIPVGLKKNWVAFEYFRRRVAIKVGVDLGSTTLKIAIAAVMAIPGGPVSVVGGAIMQTGRTVGGKFLSNAWHKLERQWILDEARHTPEAPTSIDHASSLPSPDLQSIPYQFFAWPGFYKSFAIYHHNFEESLGNLSQLEVSYESKPLLKDVPYKDKSPTEIVFFPDGRKTINGLHSFFKKKPSRLRPQNQTHFIAQFADLVFFKPPKSGDVLNKLPITWAQNLADIDSRNEKFNKLWIGSRDWPILDYLFFNQSFYEHYINCRNALLCGNKRTLEANNVQENFLFAGRTFLLAKHNFIEHYINNILPAYDFRLSEDVKQDEHPLSQGQPSNNFLLNMLVQSAQIESKRQHKNFDFLSKHIFQKIRETIEDIVTPYLLPNELAKRYFDFSQLDPLEELLKGVLLEVNSTSQVSGVYQIPRERAVSSETSFETSNFLQRKLEDPTLNPFDIRYFLQQYRQIQNGVGFQIYYKPENVRSDTALRKTLVEINTLVNPSISAKKLPEDLAKINPLNAAYQHFHTPGKDKTLSEALIIKGEGAAQAFAVNTGVEAFEFVLNKTVFKHPSVTGDVLHGVSEGYGSLRLAAGTAEFVSRLCGKSLAKTLPDVMSPFIFGTNIINIGISLALEKSKKFLFAKLDDRILKSVDKLILPITQETAPSAREPDAPEATHALTRHAEIMKKIENEDALKLGFKIKSSLSSLSADEKRLLFLEFGRVVRHLGQEAPAPMTISKLKSNVTSCLVTLTKYANSNENLDIDTWRGKKHRVTPSSYSETYQTAGYGDMLRYMDNFIDAYIDYTRARFVVHNYTYNIRRYQFIHEVLRADFLLASEAITLDNLSNETDEVKYFCHMLTHQKNDLLKNIFSFSI